MLLRNGNELSLEKNDLNVRSIFSLALCRSKMISLSPHEAFAVIGPNDDVYSSHKVQDPPKFFSCKLSLKGSIVCITAL